ncbi:uncharacterized protein LOC132171520 [Corylus avellana]|uniref:uncharacterized protein LOC132171520 n=1 Tax=Corylus avellana TaxID=13451 RepID=UPI001E1FE94A|nr:uncharacterized protein LOC132171520 [Corylus avellana]
MEGVSASMYKGLRGYWRRRDYEKLNGSGRRRRARVELGSTRRRRFWRIKTAPKLRRLRASSPKKLLRWLRDWYVNMMLRLANSRAFTAGVAGGYGGATCDAIGGFARAPSKEYDEKVIVQIYKSVVMPQGIAM